MRSTRELVTLVFAGVVAVFVVIAALGLVLLVLIHPATSIGTAVAALTNLVGVILGYVIGRKGKDE